MDIYLQELAKAGISSATKFLLEKVLAYLSDRKYQLGKELIKELLREDNYERFLKKHVSRNIKVRTIHSSEKDVFLNDIYHALSIIDIDEKVDTKIEDGYFLENNNLTNIIGLAGQGKSTILRKLFIEQLKHGEKIPFFIELAKVEESGILKQIESIFIDCGINTTEEKIENLLSSGKVLLLLDGFDEVSPLYRKQTINEIISIHRKNESQIITTTRPDTEICHEANIINYNVKKLTKQDIFAILKKLNSSSSHLDEELLPKIHKILSENKKLTQVMNSPILVTLFYICYPLLDKIPRNAVDFYENLFATLYRRHDKVKNIERYKNSSISYIKAYEVFCALSFISLYNEQGSFNELSLHNCVEESMKVSSLDTEKNIPEKVAKDFINVTCLIQKDGYDRFVYLHKSVQEYHASQFIKNMNTEKKKKLYIKIADEITENNKFSNVVKFLLSTDEDDVVSNIILPLCERFGIDKWGSATDEDVENILLEITEKARMDLYANDESDRAIVRLTLERTKYFWISNFKENKENKETSFYDSIGRFVINMILSEKSNFYTKNLDSLSIPYGRKGVVGDDHTIKMSHFIKVTGLIHDMINPMKERIADIHNEIYIKNKKKLELKNKNLEKYLDFL